jgi:flagellar FliL protein
MSKPEAKEAPSAPVGEVAAQPGAAPSGGGLKAWLPAIVAAVVAPAASFALGQYVLLPKLQAQLAAVPAAVHAAEHPAAAAPEAAAPAASAPAEAGGHGKGAKESPAAGPNYEYANLVVNLAGTMGTRYLKTSFVITGVDKTGGIRAVFEGQKDKLKDLTINVLSSLTLADLEEPGSKNLLREKLVAAYNTVLGKRVVEQVYFSDFVVQ